MRNAEDVSEWLAGWHARRQPFCEENIRRERREEKEKFASKLRMDLKVTTFFNFLDLSLLSVKRISARKKRERGEKEEFEKRGCFCAFLENSRRSRVAPYSPGTAHSLRILPSSLLTLLPSLSGDSALHSFTDSRRAPHSSHLSLPQFRSPLKLAAKPRNEYPGLIEEEIVEGGE